jgi:hypothetical protein
MVRSETDNDKGTTLPKPIRKIWVMGNIPATDKEFLEWLGRQTSIVRAHGTVYAMNLYVQQLNTESEILYEQQLKEHREYFHLTTDAVLAPEPSETNAPDGSNNTTQNISSHNPQNISSPDFQSISSPNSQNIPNPDLQNNSTLPILEPPPQINPTLPLQTSSAPAAQRADPEQRERRAGAELNANRLTMEQALEFFELMQSRRALEVDKAPTIEAHHVEVASRRAEPLSFLTLHTVEGIVGSMDFCTPQGQTTWESKMEKLVGLGHAYSSADTVTGEKCFMVDEALYRDLLLAVAARKQNEQLLIAASKKFEQHIEQISGSNERVMQKEKEAIEQMAQRMNNSYLQIQDDNKTRMKNVMTDIRALKESMAVSADHNVNSREMQQLRFEVAQYESVIPVYRARIKDTKDANQKLLDEMHEFARNIEHLKDRLNKAECLVFSMGTPESVRKIGTSGRQEHEEEGSVGSSSSEDDEDDDGSQQEQSFPSSPSSENENGGAAEPQQSADLNMEAYIDLSILLTEPAMADKGTRNRCFIAFDHTVIQRGTCLFSGTTLPRRHHGWINRNTTSSEADHSLLSWQ